MKFGEEYFNFCKNVNNFDMNCIGDWQNEYFKMLLDVFEEHVSKRTRKMLDFGCATGGLLETFRRNGHDNMFGVEVDKWYVENTPFSKIQDRMKVSESGKLPFNDAEFYFIHMSQVIEHIPEELIPSVLKELHRVLSSGGVLYVSTVGELSPDCTEDHDPTHISLFSRAKWERLFTEAGFWDVTKIYKKRFDDNKMASKYDWVNFVLSK